MTTMKDIPGYEGLYSIADDGRIYSTYYKKELKRCVNNKGYMHVILCKEKKHRTIDIHRLVAWTYIGPQNNTMVVNHKDGNKLNNHVSNLEYCSVQENNMHAKQNGLLNFGEKNHQAKLSSRDVLDIREKYSTGKFTQKEIAFFYGLSQAHISSITLRKTWKHI